MASISASVELYDRMSAPLYAITNAMNQAVSSMYQMNSAMDNAVDADPLVNAMRSINSAVEGMDNYRKMLQEGGTFDAVQIPVEWVTPNNMDIYTNSGIDRFQQEVASTNQMLTTLSDRQNQIATQAAGTDIFSASAMQDINSMSQRIQAVQQRIQQIENNPVNFGTDTANAELEQLRSQLNQALQIQENLNQAVQNMDVSAANAAYNQLSSTVANTERYIRDNVNEQGRFNQLVDLGTDGMNRLEGAIQKVVTAIGGMFAIHKVVGFINDFNDAAATQRAAETQLATTLMNMGGNVDDYDALVQKAQEIQKAGMYGDEAMIGAAAEFATYMSDTTAVELMMDTLTDYAAGMSGGGAIDYDSMVNYATNLGKITTGAYDAMTKKGFEFTDAQKAVIDGSATEVQYIEALGEGWKDMSQDMASATIISDIISESWAGMYDAMSQTPEAQLQSLMNTFGDIQEVAGNRLNASLGGLYGVIADNMPIIESCIMGFADGLGRIIDILTVIIENVAMVASFVSENWSIIAPIVYGVIAALTAYAAYLGIVKAIEFASAAASMIHALAMSAKIGITAALTGSTMAATAAQMGYNGALYACPITWIILLIIALIAIIFAVCSAIAKFTGIANSGFGVIVGAIYVVGATFKNLGLEVANIALGIGNAIATLASNMMTAFNNAICSIQSWFYNLLSTALTVIQGICAALNKLPFVEFDYSGIASAADNYAAKASAAAGNKQEYKSVADAFNKGFSTFDTFQDGWASDAFKSGAAWGDGVADKVSGMFSMDNIDPTGGVDTSFLSNDFANNAAQTAANTADTANSAGKIADSVDISNENLKYLRDIAETDAINRFTTAEITVNQTNNNNVSSDTDIDGMVDSLSAGVLEAMEQAAEGVH